MSPTGRKRSRGNQASTESHSTQSNDPSPHGDIADEIIRKGEERFKRIKQECIKASRTMPLLGDICDQLYDQKREIEQLKVCIVGQDATNTVIENERNVDKAFDNCILLFQISSID